MKIADWWKIVDENKPKLASMIARFHPSERSPNATFDGLPITANAAESACKMLRKNMQRPDPVEAFEVSVAIRNEARVGAILHETWFGIPESLGCWDIPGFSKLVSLLDDPPDDLPDLFGETVGIEEECE